MKLIDTQVVSRERLSETRLCVPEKFCLLPSDKILHGFLHGFRLLVTELIGNYRIRIFLRYHAVVLRKINKIPTGSIRFNEKPFCASFTSNPQFFQIGVEVLIRKGSIWFRHERCPHSPPGLMCNADSMGLLLNPGFHIPLSKADLCPAVMRRYAGRGIGITLRCNFCSCLNFDCRHYAISFMWDSINSISFSSKPYFR